MHHCAWKRASSGHDRWGRFARVVLIASAALVCGCVYRVTPPAEPSVPVTVYIARHDDTARLVLPGEEGYAAYGYGDWRWYALNRMSPLDGIAALLVPTRSGLGREVLSDGPITAAALWADELLEVEVGGESALALRRRLDEQFRQREEDAVDNRLRGMVFVPGERPYWVFNNSSSVLAGWLRELGCTVRGWALVARFEVREP